MKTNWLTLGIGLFVILYLISCQKDEYLPAVQGDAKIKSILLYFSLDSGTPTGIIKEFEYDENGRIIKIKLK
jgi:hypothetical protein